MEPFDASAVRAAYDVLAEDHAEAFADDLLGLTVDREVLDSVVPGIAEEESVLDLGCRPGQVGRTWPSGVFGCSVWIWLSRCSSWPATYGEPLPCLW